MPVPWPRCGDETPHPGHPAVTADFSVPGCPGWTEGQQRVRRLILGVRKYMNEHYPRPAPLPAGLRLEMHPSVRRLLMTDPDVWEPGWGAAGDAEDFFLLLPARVTVEDMKPGGWRLVIVTEEILLTGE